MVIWVTGLSGAGKTTLCEALFALLKPGIPELVKLDGDTIRAALGGDLGYREADRHVQIGRIQRMSRLLSDQGLVVLTAALYAHPDLLAWNRANIRGYFEIYIRAPMPLLRERDSKGLYAKAAQGREKDVVGVDIPWHEPSAPDLVIDAESAPPPEALARRVAEAVPRLSAALGARP